MKPAVRSGLALACAFALSSRFAAHAGRAAMGDALAATQLLSGLVDTRVVRFELPVAPSTPAKSVHAVVLSFDGIQWLYTPGLGTCVLGPTHPAAAGETELIAARIRQLAPAVGEVRVFDRPLLPPPEWEKTLRNGCVAACVLDLADLLARHDDVTDAGIIFLSSRPTPRTDGDRSLAGLEDLGHSLLAYRIGDRWWALDPVNPDAPFALESVAADTAADPVLVAHLRRQHYMFEHVRFLGISRPALNRLAANARWRATQAVLPRN